MRPLQVVSLWERDWHSDQSECRLGSGMFTGSCWSGWFRGVRGRTCFSTETVKGKEFCEDISVRVFGFVGGGFGLGTEVPPK